MLTPVVLFSPSLAHHSFEFTRKSTMTLHLGSEPYRATASDSSIVKRIDRAQLVRDLSVGLGVQKAMATFTQSRDYWALR